ncbi:aminotransferase class III-fold pyridoxal phosphate-dependent enzyme [Amycolatopsis rhabdoformis]|uniref:Aminotransferase class III-fold pyridoxal phosphate-dependent enzyme n=1 Tax=Amycolatopsis rhabdoformis TaxID=1448059 RepID=A0ABZ1HZ95_9PSEU|nr:aminotransferase class III-fold pyridoxal phosphate-dependent enzyme [Amycolatopsis rhabdoformis]WSE26868.1 aminotransferase class III-fold pyridoxal phosphate-dependent enzyme [Amycolatopsis rhabdoformis]
MAELSPLLKQATPVVVDHGEGVYLYDVDGKRHLDFTAGIGVTSTGHCHPRVVEAARDQIGKLIHGQYTTVMHKPLLELTKRLGEVLPTGLDSLFYANSGSEAVEAALRLARQATQRPNVIVFQGGFHGRTVAAATMTTSGTRFSTGIGPLMGGVHVAPFPYAYHYGWDEQTATKFALRELDYLFQTVSAPSETAAFFVEPILGEGGYVPANSEFLAGLRERADRHGIVLVLDEVQAGFGRTGKFWGHDHFGITPDVVLIAKGLASGFPLSGIAASQELMAKAYPGSQGGTYGGNAVSCAAAVATLDVIRDEKLVENAAERGRQLLEGARLIADKTPAIGEVRGLGLLVGTEFTAADGTPDTATAAAAQQTAAKNGLLLLTCGAYSNVVRMVPPLVVNAEQVDDALKIWGDVVASVTAGS